VTNITITGQRFGEHFPTANISAVTDELLEVGISLRLTQSYKRALVREKRVQSFSHKRIQKLSAGLWSANQRATEAEEVSTRKSEPNQSP
jgi:hypothetical protein